MKKIIALFGLLLVLSLIVGCATLQKEVVTSAVPAATEEGTVADNSAVPAAETPAEDAAEVSEEVAEPEAEATV